MKIGIVTFVHGWYLDYIPIYVYSIRQAYPEYDIKIFIPGKLPEHLKGDFQVEENFLVEHSQSDDPTKKPYYLRWLIPYEYLNEFDGVFICDVDLLMLREKPMMHDQRMEVCKKTGLPFANFVRRPHPSFPKRITGWHFLITEPYYKKVNPIIESILSDSNFDISNPPSYCYDNGTGEKQWGQEALLYQMMHLAFGDIDDKIAEDRLHMSYHHGLHLGPFRGELSQLVRAKNPKGIKHLGRNLKYWNSEILNLLTDRVFLKLLDEIKEERVRKVFEKVQLHFLGPNIL